MDNYRTFAKQVRTLEVNMDYQLRVLKSFLDFKTSVTCPDGFREVANKVNSGLGLVPGKAVTNKNIKFYEHRIKELYNEREIGYILGNYLVYCLFSKPLIIFGLQGGFYTLSFFYAFIRFIAVGVAISEGVPVDNKILIKAISVVDYNIRHSGNYMDHIMLAQGIDKFETEHVSIAKSLALLAARGR
ncbi:MAG: hypothetical protein M0Z31_03830 [Clostridia bacterium]|nr:hypothetical protein [Clostridia bacterium]